MRFRKDGEYVALLLPCAGRDVIVNNNSRLKVSNAESQQHKKRNALAKKIKEAVTTTK